MSWINHILPKIKREDDSSKKPSPVPEGVWTKCPGCDQVLYTEELDRSLKVCPKCGYHHRIGARARLLAFLDPGTAVEVGGEIRAKDPLGFVDSKPYVKRHEQARNTTGETDALIVMSGELRREPMVAGRFRIKFMAGSMGSVVGERFSRGVDEAIRRNAPFVCFAASGGARMQEGLVSLMQMAKTTAAVTRLSEAGLPFISVLTDPTMGGVSASFAFMGGTQGAHRLCRSPRDRADGARKAPRRLPALGIPPEKGPDRPHRRPSRHALAHLRDHAAPHEEAARERRLSHGPSHD